MRLARELEALAAAGAKGAKERLADAEALDRLGERVARGRRRANVSIALASAAVIGLGASAWSMPREPDPAPTSPTPAPSATASAGAEPLPPLDSAGYLVNMTGAFRTNEAITCEMIPTATMTDDAVPYPGLMPPLPTWIEANRIYGVADGLPAHYPIPLYSRDGAMFYGLAAAELTELYPDSAEVVVALIAADGSWWGFDADYREIDEMPFDPAGLFVTLTPNEDCKGGPRAVDRSRIPAGHYDARVMVIRNDGREGNLISDHGDVEVVTGLPSVPSLEYTK